ncbi:MAG: hypothetical protein H6729_14930, partial [Deltaproteobacteria bacterium]|nr:hypothetical protein [Deltaproteobacteria bacterium]
DLDKLHAYLEASAAFERDERIGWGVMGSIFGPSVGLTGVGLLKLSADVKDRDKKNALRGAGIGLAVTGGVTLGVGLIELLVDSESEEILRAFQSADVSTEAARAEALFSTEALWHERVERVAAKRRLVGGAAIASGILYGAIGTYFLTHPTGASGRQSSSEGYVLGGTSIALGLATLGAGIYVLDRARHPVERTWDLYTNERVPSSEAATGRAFSIAPSILGADGFGAVAAGRF